MVYDLVGQALPAGTCPAGTPASQAGNNALVVSRSPVFGDTTGATAGIEYSAATPLSCDEGIMGDDVTYGYSAALGGPTFYVIHDNAALNDISVVRCAIGAESATNPSGLTDCADHVVSSFPGYRTGANFPTMAVDDTGNLFAVWEEAPVDSSGNVTGNTLLYYSTSTDRGTTWSPAAQIPTGENQNVFAWPAAGDPGRIDVAFYGAPEAATGTAGPDSMPAHYSLYLAQNLTGSYPLNASAWTTTLASEHFIHYGTMYTLIGGQTGNRTLGDSLQMRLGPQGEANVSFADSNDQDSGSTPEAMYVRQVRGPSLYRTENRTGQVSLPVAPTGNCVSGDPASAKDATFDAFDTVGPDNPNLDITKVCLSKPDANHYRATLTIANLTSLAPGAQAGGTTLLWQVQWHEPSSSDTTNGGALLMLYAESTAGGTPTCWDGQSATELVGLGGVGTGGGAELTYPGSKQLTGPACKVTQSAPGTITITAPISDFTAIVPHPDSSTLYSVTASSQTLEAPAEQPAPVGGIGGQLFNVIDATPPSTSTPPRP
jgi:hypothetical protein